MMDLLHASGLLMQEGLPASLGLPTLPAIVFTPWGQPGGPAAAAAVVAAEASEQPTVQAVHAVHAVHAVQVVQQGQAPSAEESDPVSAGHMTDTATTAESAGAHELGITTTAAAAAASVAAAAAAAAARAVPGLPLASTRVSGHGSDEARDPLHRAHPGAEAETAEVHTGGQAGIVPRYELG